MTLRRVPPSILERLTGHNDSMTPGTVGGRVRNASPILFGESDSEAVDSGSVGASGGVVADAAVTDLFAYDAFTLAADGAQDLTLTRSAIDESMHVYLNGIEQLKTTDWTLSGTTLSILAGMGALTGDVLDVRYAYTTDIPDDAEAG